MPLSDGCAQNSGDIPAKRIVAFGDSTTAPRAGVEVYTDQLAKRFADPHLEFLNKGVPGNTTEQAKARFQRDVLDQHPQVVVIQFGINDSAIDVWKNPPMQTSRVSASDYEGNLRYFVKQIKEQGGQVILMTPNQIRWTPKLVELYGKPPYQVEDERGFCRFLSGYAEIVRKVAAEEGVPLVDVFAGYDDWEKANGKSCSSLLLDGMHPSTDGQRLVTEALEPVLRNVVVTEEKRGS